MLVQKFIFEFQFDIPNGQQWMTDYYNSVNNQSSIRSYTQMEALSKYIHGLGKIKKPKKSNHSTLTIYKNSVHNSSRA